MVYVGYLEGALNFTAKIPINPKLVCGSVYFVIVN